MKLKVDFIYLIEFYSMRFKKFFSIKKKIVKSTKVRSDFYDKNANFEELRLYL